MKFAIIVSALLLAIGGSARAGLINGDFETGDLTGWTVFNTTHGGTNLADVVMFDTTTPGVPSYSARLQVGQTSGNLGPTGNPEGAGLSQSVSLNSGTLNIFLNIAESSTGVNGDGGTFELLLNGVVVDAVAFGIVGPGTERATLSYSGVVAGGPAEITAVDARRDFGIGVPNTPIQYFDNITLSGTAVPEPSAIALAFLGVTVLLSLRGRRPALARA